MICSMTAFARASLEGEWGRAVWEIRSVNHRYLEVVIRLPEDLRGLESNMREQVNARLGRGKIECNLRYSPTTSDAPQLAVNQAMVEQLLNAARNISAMAEATQPINTIDILRYPGVLETPRIDLEETSKGVTDALELALDQLVDTRSREGDKLKTLVEKRCDGIEEQLQILRRRVPDIIASIRERHEQRIRDLASALDQGRVEQECALLVQRLDVAEEIDRLEAHLQEVRRVLGQAQPMGRRLDFLMQELNREANTLGSKSAHIDTSNGSVELKVLIEQIREQIQNIE